MGFEGRGVVESKTSQSLTGFLRLGGHRGSGRHRCSFCRVAARAGTKMSGRPHTAPADVYVHALVCPCVSEAQEGDVFRGKLHV